MQVGVSMENLHIKDLRLVNSQQDLGNLRLTTAWR